MGSFATLAERDLAAVTEYVKFFSRRWREPENYAPSLTFPPPPEWLREPAALEDHAMRGKVLFDSACAACHGAHGDGRGVAAGTLKDMWGFDVTPSDLRQPHLRCGSGALDVYRVLTTGLDGTPMVSFAAVFTPEQRWDLVAYLVTLRPPESR